MPSYACSMGCSRAALRQCLILEHCVGSEVDALSVAEDEMFYQVALIDQAIQAFGILDDPGAIIPADLGVQARDALGWNLYIIP